MDPLLSDARIDARQLCLTAFRDAIILPRYEKLTLSLSEEMSRINDKDGDRDENWQWARIQQMLLVLGSSSRTSNGDVPSRGEQATNQLLGFFRRSLPPPMLGHLRDKNTSGFTGIGMARGFIRKPGGVSGVAGDRRGRVDFSPSSRRGLHDPQPNYAENSQGETANNDYQQRNPRLDTYACGLRRGYESDDEEDYGQVVQR